MKQLSLAILLVTTASAVAQPVDLVLRNGKIVTVDKAFSVVEAMAIHQGRVLATGSNATINQRIGPKTKIIDLQGRMVLPGLIDSHVHPSGASQFEADHRIPSMNTIKDVQAYIRTRTKVVPKGEWIRLSQVFITRLREQRFPDRYELDKAAPHHPVFFRTGPDGSANSLALKLNGVTKEFAAKHPQRVMVDRSGEPTGVIRRASSIIRTKANSTRRRLTTSDRDNRLVKLFKDYNRTGITSVIDRNCGDSARRQYQRLLETRRLSVRVRMSRGVSPRGKPSAFEKRLDTIVADPFFKEPHPLLGVIGVKVFLDGGMLTGSAYFNRPWGVSKIYGITDGSYRGMRFIAEDRLRQLVQAVVKRKLAFTAHCQGDAAVETLLRAYEHVNKTIPVAPTHSTITHSSFMSAKAITAAAKLGIGVDLQPAWLYLDARTLVAQFGEYRLKYFIPLASLFKAGVVAGGGSDHMQKIGSLRSVNPYNPFLGMWVAVTRTARWHDRPVHLEQALTRQQMIRFYTINNAWLMRYAHEVGSLEKGKRADFVVIDRDLLTCAADQIRSTKVLSTWMDGKRVHVSRKP